VPRPTGSMPPVVSLAIGVQHPGLMSTASQAGYELGKGAKSRVTYSAKPPSCRRALAEVTTVPTPRAGSRGRPCETP